MEEETKKINIKCVKCGLCLLEGDVILTECCALCTLTVPKTSSK